MIPRRRVEDTVMVLRNLCFAIMMVVLGGFDRPSVAAPGDVILKIDNPQPGIQDQFGAEVSVSKKDLAIGAPQDSNTNAGGGSVSFYETKTLTFRQLLNRTGLDTFTSFGVALAISGSSVVIGEPQGDVNFVPDSGHGYMVSLKTITYQRTFENALQTAQDYMGLDVAARKKLFAFGIPGDDTVTTNAGVVYLFDQKSSSPLRILFPASTSQNQEFGSSLAFLNNVLATGAPGQIALAGANAGAVHLNDSRTREFLGLLVESPQRAGARFGAAVAGTKKLLAVGAPGEVTSGAVYLYNLGTGAAARRIDNPTPDAGDLFGISVAFVGTKYVLVGAPGDDFGGTNAGAAYVFDYATGNLLVTIINPESSPGDRFGHVVATDGKLLYVGCPGNVVSGLPGAGSVFVLEGL